MQDKIVLKVVLKSWDMDIFCSTFFLWIPYSASSNGPDVLVSKNYLGFGLNFSFDSESIWQKICLLWNNDDIMPYFWSTLTYTQSPFIRTGPIRLGAEFWEKFKTRALGRSNLRNAPKNLRNPQCSDFQS